TDTGVADAQLIGRTRLTPPYHSFVSTGAARATRMAEILRTAAGQNDLIVREVAELRSQAEDRWRQVAQAAGKGATVEQMRAVDPELVDRECQLLGAALRGVLALLPEGGRALVVGHSPTNEAAVLGLTGTVVDPLGKGSAVLITEDDGQYSAGPLP